MAESNGNVNSKIDKLRGRENFDTWKVAARSYLIIKGLWIVIEDEISAEESPVTNQKAIGELTLLIEGNLYNYIAESRNAIDVWKGLQKAFEDKGTARKVTILNKLVSVKLVEHKRMEQYINTILLYWNKTKLAGFTIHEDVVASLMLGGLPEQYRAMILGIENSGQDLTVDYVKTVLLQGIPDPYAEQDDIAMAATCVNRNCQGAKRCFKCGDLLHLLANCPRKNLRCNLCGDNRHLAARCPRNKKKTEDAEAKSEGKTEAKSEENPNPEIRM